MPKLLINLGKTLATASVFVWANTYAQQTDTNTIQALVPQPIVDTSPAGQEPSQELTQYDQLQAIRYEVQELRGQVEELNYQIEQLKKQRIKDYLDLDRRLIEISERSEGNIAPTASYINDSTTFETSTNEFNDFNATTGISEANEHNTTNDVDVLYQQAFNLLRNKQASEALEQFITIIENYATTDQAANSLFWAGRIYQLQKKDELARQQFVQFLKNFPTHRKAGEVAYFLGKIYFDLGDIERTAALMDLAVNSSDTKVINLVNKFIENNLTTEESSATAGDATPASLL